VWKNEIKRCFQVEKKVEMVFFYFGGECKGKVKNGW